FESRSLSKQLTRADIRTNFEYFKSTGTPTLYAGTNVEEEFAEIFMFHFYDDLKWKSDSEVVYDLKSEFQTTAALKAKRDFIKALLAKPKPFSLEAFGAISGEIPVL
ncbi:MAG: hypothetical protein V4692_08245, partial [Bdellovibrionota bacterium]